MFNFGIDKDYDGVEFEYILFDDDFWVIYVIFENGFVCNLLKISMLGICNYVVVKICGWCEWNKLQYQIESVEFDVLDEFNLLVRND